MGAIHKFKLPIGIGSISINMPIESHILSAGWQGQSIVIWAEVDPANSKGMENVEFLILMTGQEFDFGMYPYRMWIATITNADGIVAHVYLAEPTEYVT